jgi:trans-2,3-dihydro-3-hydroxyanthranilate isomerase
MARECQILRVFTRDEIGGNHLGVVTDVTGLDGATMQAVAADLGFSETIFCDITGDVPSARIFTPGVEMAFAGHPLVGLAWALGEVLDGPVTRIRCPVGDVEVNTVGMTTWIKASGGQTVEPIDFPPLDGEVAVLVEMPTPYLLIRLSSARQVAELVAPPPSFGQVYAWAWEDPGRVVKARFFAGEMAVPEDPATGSAAVALAAHLRDSGQSDGSLVIHQGDEIGHPSTIQLRWDQATASIGGTVVRDEVRTLDV